jgi:hypothetical protein
VLTRPAPDDRVRRCLCFRRKDRKFLRVRAAKSEWR